MCPITTGAVSDHHWCSVQSPLVQCPITTGAVSITTGAVSNHHWCVSDHHWCSVQSPLVQCPITTGAVSNHHCAVSNHHWCQCLITTGTVSDHHWLQCPITTGAVSDHHWYSVRSPTGTVSDHHCWLSKKQPVVVLSTTEAEYHFEQTCKEVVWFSPVGVVFKFGSRLACYIFSLAESKMSAERDVYIETHLNGFVLDIEGSSQADGANVISCPRTSPTSPNQQWYLDYRRDGTFFIVSKLNGKVLDCAGQEDGEHLNVSDRDSGAETRAPNAPLILSAKNSPATSNQQFSIKSQDVYIKTHLNGFVLDTEGSSQANGAKVISYPIKSPPCHNQQWYLDHQPDKTFLIVSKLSGKVLYCAAQEIGEQLILCDRNGGENQRFKRERNYLTTMQGLVVSVKDSNEAPNAPIILCSKNILFQTTSSLQLNP
eukprot:Em0002g919a